MYDAGAQVQEFCGFGTKEECSRSNANAQSCDKLHFKKIISKHTDGG
jgi:mRNA m6A methyltransferase catalytic subunit